MSGEHAGHSHASVTAHTDRRWLAAALGVIVAFMCGEVLVGLLAHSLALLADASHMLTDAAALALAILASRLAQRPARGSYTFGFARIDALSAQANGLTLLLLAAWLCVAAVGRLVGSPAVHGAPVLITALVGIVVNVVAALLAGRANKASLNVRGAVAHIVSDLYAFVATALAGLIIVLGGTPRADAVASLVVAALMVRSGAGLVRAAGRVFLEAAPSGLDPRQIGGRMADVPGVVEIHDLHVWDLGGSEPALSAHVVVDSARDCHQVAQSVRLLLLEQYGISHATLQADHRAHDPAEELDDCRGDTHGPGYGRSSITELPTAAIRSAGPASATETDPAM